MYLEFPRGDQFWVSFSITDKNGTITENDIDEVIITCRKAPYSTRPVLFQKKKTKNDIIFNSETKKWEFMMLNKDTQNLEYGEYGFDIEVRVGDIINTKTGVINLTDEYTMEDNNGY